MGEAKTCPFCGAPTVRETVGGVVVFRCNTGGPDEAAVHSTGRPCDIITFTREVKRLEALVEDRTAAALWLRIVLTNMTQGEQMAGVYERWPWLNPEADE